MLGGSAKLDSRHLQLICEVLGRHPAVTSAILFGSRAKGTATIRSDIDLALTGEVTPVEVFRIADELEELPIPNKFDVKLLSQINHAPLREHISRVGVRIYPA